MCHDLDSRPPIPRIAGAAVDGRRVELEASDGARFIAFAAQPRTATGAGVLIFPDVRGLHSFYEELALRFAEHGIDAIAIDYFGRTARTDDRGEDFDFREHVEQVRFDDVMRDARAARGHLASRRVRAVFTVGFCFGGRLSFVASTRPELDLSGVVGFYGVPQGPGRAATPEPVAVAEDVLCPILGLFGGADQGIPQASIEAYRAALVAAGVEHDLITYPGAPHSFFDRKADQYAAESADAWRRVLEFVGRHTPAP